MIAGQEPPSAALVADKTSVVSAAKTSVVSAAKKAAIAATSAATSHITIKSTTPWEGAPPIQGVVDGIEMSDVAVDVAAVAAFLAADTTDVLAANTTDVLSAAKAADSGSCPAVTQDGIGLIWPQSPEMKSA